MLENVNRTVSYNGDATLGYYARSDMINFMDKLIRKLITSMYQLYMPDLVYQQLWVYYPVS